MLQVRLRLRERETKKRRDEAALGARNRRRRPSGAPCLSPLINCVRVCAGVMVFVISVRSDLLTL